MFKYFFLIVNAWLRNQRNGNKQDYFYPGGGGADKSTCPPLPYQRYQCYQRPGHPYHIPTYRRW